MAYEIPVQGANAGTWGTDLNTYLQREHGATGLHAGVTATSIVVSGATTGTIGSFTGRMTCREYNILGFENNVVFYENEVVVTL